MRRGSDRLTIPLPLRRASCATALAAMAVLAGPRPSHAQVTLDLNALDRARPGTSAPSDQEAPAAPSTGSTRHAPPRHHGHERPTAKKTTPQATPPAATPPVANKPETPAAPPPVAAPPAATLPTTVPPAVSLSPDIPGPPVAPPVPPPSSPIAADAGGDATPIAHGITVTFDADRAELSPASAEAIKEFARTVPAGDVTSINVLAYAAGKPEDASTARRLSLSRALGIRSVLMEEGIASTRIYVRALGSTAAEGSPDRADLTMSTPTPAPPAPPPAAPLTASPAPVPPSR